MNFHPETWQRKRVAFYSVSQAAKSGSILRMKIAPVAFLFVCTVVTAQNSKDQSTIPAPPSPLPAAISSETSELIRQTVAKVVAYGEFAKICIEKQKNDQTQLRDVQARLRDAKDRLADLVKERDSQTLRLRTLPQRDPQIQSITSDIININTKIEDTNNLFKGLSKQETDFNSDIDAQQNCINIAETQLGTFITNPAKPPSEQKK